MVDLTTQREPTEAGVSAALILEQQQGGHQRLGTTIRQQYDSIHGILSETWFPEWKRG
tara:strand:- start:383 stop:556 length:174 start_codon:yes stop_codon:yes gene_type:complete